jgi:hypothetical protein
MPGALDDRQSMRNVFWIFVGTRKNLVNEMRTSNVRSCHGRNVTSMFAVIACSQTPSLTDPIIAEMHGVSL